MRREDDGAVRLRKVACRGREHTPRFGTGPSEGKFETRNQRSTGIVNSLTVLLDCRRHGTSVVPVLEKRVYRGHDAENLGYFIDPYAETRDYVGFAPFVFKTSIYDSDIVVSAD